MDKMLKDVLAAVGNQYTVRMIDGADCVYRDLGDFEIEIVGHYRRNHRFDIYVWGKSPVQIVYRKHDIKNITNLCTELDHVLELHQARLLGTLWPEEV